MAKVVELEVECTFLRVPTASQPLHQMQFAGVFLDSNSNKNHNQAPVHDIGIDEIIFNEDLTACFEAIDK